jgi:hypothetical protein
VSFFRGGFSGFFWGFFLGFREEVERKKGFPKKERGVVGDRGMKRRKKKSTREEGVLENSEERAGNALVLMG